MIPISARQCREIVCFGLVGVTATATHYLVALLSHELLLINLYVANLCGYGTALAVSFVGHGTLTFRVDLTRARLQRFIVASVGTFLFSELILWLLETATGLSHRYSLIVVVLIVPLVSYGLNKFWVYRR